MWNKKARFHLPGNVLSVLKSHILCDVVVVGDVVASCLLSSTTSDAAIDEEAEVVEGGE